MKRGISAVKQPEQQLYHCILLFTDISKVNTKTPCIHFVCMHTLYLPRKGCLPPLISMSSSRSNMHLTGRPVLLKEISIRQTLNCTIQLLQKHIHLFSVLPEWQWWHKLGITCLDCASFSLKKKKVRLRRERKTQIQTFRVGTCS